MGCGSIIKIVLRDDLEVWHTSPLPERDVQKSLEIYDSFFAEAARYFDRLTRLDTVISKSSKPYSELATHKEYVITLKDKHGKKRSFWEKVND